MVAFSETIAAGDIPTLGFRIYLERAFSIAFAAWSSVSPSIFTCPASSRLTYPSGVTMVFRERSGWL